MRTGNTVSMKSQPSFNFGGEIGFTVPAVVAAGVADAEASMRRAEVLAKVRQ